MRDALELLGEDHVVERMFPVTYDNQGRLQKPMVVSEQVHILGQVTPLTGNDIRRLPEGEKPEKYRTVISVEAMRTSDGGTPADVLVYKGDRYEVQASEDWTDQGGFYKALVRKVQ